MCESKKIVYVGILELKLIWFETHATKILTRKVSLWIFFTRFAHERKHQKSKILV